MFHGSLPDSVQRIMGDGVRRWNCSDIFIGCSGNFTIERMLKGVTDARLHGNDVTIYSCLLGDYFAGVPLTARFNENYDGPMTFLRDYMKTDIDIVTVVMLLSKMSVYLGSKPNPYYLKMIDAYKAQWGTIFEQTRSKLEKAGQFLSSFYSGDVIKWVDEVPPEQGFICYPPFYSGDYEKMFKVIEQIIEWEQPEYEMIDKDKIFEMFRKLTEREYFMFGTNDELEEFSDYLVGVSQTTNRGVPLYIYSKAPKSRIVMPSQQVDSLFVERIGKDEDIGDKIRIMELKSENFRALRSQYMNPYIKPGSETSSYGVIVDNKLIGVYAFSASPTLSNWDKHIETPTMYLLSDFPIAPTKYKRLAKLVLYAALSKESKLLAERITNHRIRSLVTTAFSKNPVSMKYRGLFKLLNKKKLDGVDEGETDMSKIYYNQGYQLNYGAAMGEWTLAEGLALWKQKHSQTEGREER
ncbi:hypothetical protein AGMMS49975_24120 [Clostridia bacterium]|nr:hypothetical protein AGMMS49975_24120 [Clostridia bacterium]